MLAIQNKPLEKEDNVVQVTMINGRLGVKPEARYNKDGSIDKRHCNKMTGESSEVYAFNTKEEIKAMMNVFDKHIVEAATENQRQIAHRNKLLFLIGINIGIRASDLRTLRWEFFLKENGEFKDSYKLQPKKQKKQKKFVTLYFNQTVKKAITDYIELYPIDNLNDYLFTTQKGNEPISVGGLWRIIKEASEEAKIEKNIGSHSLRKTFGYWAWHNAQDKDKALVTLQMVFNHSSTQVTMKYIGLLNTEIEDMFNSVDLVFDYI